MTRARKHLVSVTDTPYYHITARCVRRAFLCGIDRQSGRNYEHRRLWIEDRIRVLSSLFCIDICAYAVMSNHYHLVVRLSPSEADNWSDIEVLDRWTSLFRGTLLVQQFRDEKLLSPAEREAVAATAAVYRSRLASLSWFMKCLNEPIARKANAEDGCTGHFWEARFHSQALCSEKALISAMAYVDLNPVRASTALTPETSEHTSVAARVRAREDSSEGGRAVSRMMKGGDLFRFNTPLRSLLAFADTKQNDHDLSLPMKEREYLMLLDHSARRLVHGKRGRMNPETLPILERLGLAEEEWIESSTRFRMHYRNGDLRRIKVA